MNELKIFTIEISFFFQSSGWPFLVVSNGDGIGYRFDSIAYRFQKEYPAKNEDCFNKNPLAPSWGPPIGLGETARVISGPANTDAAI